MPTITDLEQRVTKLQLALSGLNDLIFTSASQEEQQALQDKVIVNNQQSIALVSNNRLPTLPSPLGVTSLPEFDPTPPSLLQRGSYIWSSKVTPEVGIGRKLYVDRPGEIERVYMFCSQLVIGDVTGDVLKNGTTIFTTTSKPKIKDGFALTTDAVPDVSSFVAGDYFQPSLLTVGGATDRISIVIVFKSNLPLK